MEIHRNLIHNLVDIASKGGNYLLNVGPKADGTFPAESVDLLKGMGAWMKVNGEAVYATKASPLRYPALGTLHDEEGSARYYSISLCIRLARRRQTDDSRIEK